MTMYVGTIESYSWPAYSEATTYSWWQNPSTGWNSSLDSIDGCGEEIMTDDFGLSSYQGGPIPLDLSTDCALEKGFAETHYWRVWCYPRRLDFGSVPVGDQRVVYVLNRFDDISTLSSESSDSPDFGSDSEDLLPMSFPPLYERETLMTVISQERVVEVSREYRFIFEGSAGTAKIDLSVILAVLYKESAMTAVGAMRLQYKFDTQVELKGSGRYYRWSKLAKPVRKTGLEVVAHQGDAGSIDELYEKIPDTGKVSTIAPLWCFWETLTAAVTVGGMILNVEDATEFEVGGLVVLITTGVVEVKSIESIDANAITLVSAVENDYPAEDTWVVPGMAGIGTVTRAETIAQSKILEAEFEVTESVVKDTFTTDTITEFLLRPDEVLVGGVPKPDRKAVSVEMGVPATEIYNTEQRTPLLHSMGFLMKGTEYRELRDAFVKNRGRALPLRVPTWKGELEVLQEAVLGASSIRVGQLWYNDDFAAKIDKLWFDWYGLEVQSVTVSSVEVQSEYVDITFSPSLARQVPAGFRVSLMPSVFFATDDLELDFRLKGLCAAEVDFEEEVRE